MSRVTAHATDGTPHRRTHPIVEFSLLWDLSLWPKRNAKPNMPTPKTAVLVTGEMRTHHPFSKNIVQLSHLSPTFFVSTWETAGTKLMGWLAPPQMSRVLNDKYTLALPRSLYGLEPLRSRMPIFFRELGREQTSIKRGDFAILEPVSVNIQSRDSFAPVKFDGNSIEYIFYKLNEAVGQMLDYETASNTVFTL